MHVLQFHHSQPPKDLGDVRQIPDEGLVWVDIVRGDLDSWECWAEPLLGVAIEPQHVLDSYNQDHPSFFDGTADYDMLIFQGLGPRDDPFPLETRTVAFFMFDRVLLTVRATDNVSLIAARQKLLDGRLKPPGNVLKLAHAILDTMVDRYLKVREPLDKHCNKLQDELLDPAGNMEDWRSLLESRRVARQLEGLSESQAEALDCWRRGTRLDWSATEEVRIRDLSEHVGRVRNHASGTERDIEAAVQLHFAAISHRTNVIMRVFTVVSVVFMPMMLLSSIWGMNFEHMPELHWPHAYLMALLLMGAVGTGCWLYFKRRGYL